jgi:hypothetical protein
MRDMGNWVSLDQQPQRGLFTSSETDQKQECNITNHIQTIQQ